MAQERRFPVVLPELQYTRNCSTEISIHNTSQRFVDVDVAGHKSTGSLVSLADRPHNHLHLRPSEKVALRVDVDNDVAWAEIIEIVPSPRLKPVLAIAGKTECLDGNELVTEQREIAPLVANPHFNVDQDAAALNGKVLLLINASDQRMQWSACYSGGSTVSDGKGGMRPLCLEQIDRTLAPYESARLSASIGGNPLVQFHAEGSAVALQLLAPSVLKVQLYRVQAIIRFDQ